MKPYYKKIVCDDETPVSLYSKLAFGQAYAFLFESAEPDQTIGRYSIIGFNPSSLYVFPAAGKQNPVEVIKNAYEQINYESDSNLPRFQAAFVGYFSYEVARHFEKLNLPIKNAEIPESIFFLPKNLLIFDHFEHSLTFIAYSKEDLDHLLKTYEKRHEKPALIPLEKDFPGADSQNPIAQKHGDEGFDNLVLTAKESICAGEVFQIVISQLFQQKTLIQPFDLYRRLRAVSPSPYMFYMQYPDFSIVGSSPESLIRTENEEVIIRPIAGTRRRGKNQIEDALLAEELENDPKERAEHMMLVDLGRNDIGRIAKPGSVSVTRLAKLEKYSHVMHLVSEIRAVRAPEKSLFDVFKAAFPAGTLSGAPKIRAMELIAELEKSPRDIYGGAVGYFDLSGNMDFAIAIRTMIHKNGAVSLRAGAGIVFDSVPNLENLECRNKAKGPLAALTN